MSDTELMLTSALLLSISVSVLVVPLMIRLAPRLGMVDRPSARKVHDVPMARVGGWGIALGTLIPVLLWAGGDPLVLHYTLACAVLIVWGLLDDTREVGHYFKFIGQFLAVIPVVYLGDLYVASFPFLDEPLPAEFGKPFTVFAMVGMINAINHSDGLDGLAGGEATLSLIVMALLAWLAEGMECALIAVAAVGSVLGFLRFNTHPARVFMGDVGSQFLGFTVGFLAVLLSQRANPAISPAAVGLLLGLPVVDILAVFAQRIHKRMNWFAASRNHIHHRLLDLGFPHHEAVILIYGVQAVLVISGALLRYESDALLLGLYAVVCGSVFAGLLVAERGGWHRRTGPGQWQTFGDAARLVGRPVVRVLPVAAVGLLVPAYLLLGTFSVGHVPRDFAILSGVLFVAGMAQMLADRPGHVVVLRAALYAAAAFVVYLSTEYPVARGGMVARMDVTLLPILAIALVLAMRFSRQGEFTTTPMDYLILFVLLAFALMSQGMYYDADVAPAILKAVVLIYGCELVLSRLVRRTRAIAFPSLMALAVLGAKGLA